MIEVWACITAIAPILANVATVVGLTFIALQLRTAVQTSRVQAWAFLLDTSNKRWSQYITAKSDSERRFALGELLNFMEVIANDINRDRFPYAIVEQVTPYFLGVIDLMVREPTLRDEVRSMVMNVRTFSGLRELALCHRDKFGDRYIEVETMFRMAASTASPSQTSA